MATVLQDRPAVKRRGRPAGSCGPDNLTPMEQVNDHAYDAKFHLHETRGDLFQGLNLDRMGDAEIDRAIALADVLVKAYAERNHEIAAAIIQALPGRLRRLKALDQAEGMFWQQDAPGHVGDTEEDVLAIIGLSEPRHGSDLKPVA